QLGAVAEPQNGDAELVDPGVDGGRRRLVDGLGAAREDDPFRRPRPDLLDGDARGDDLRIDVGLADPAGDESCVLGAEVDDQDGVRGVGQCPIPTPWDRWKNLPSVCSDGATMTSAFWNSFTVS